MMNRKMKSLMSEDMPDFMTDMMESEEYQNREKKPEKVEYEAFMVTTQEKAMIESMRNSKQGQEEYES